MALKQTASSATSNALSGPQLGSSLFDFPQSAGSAATAFIVPILSWLSTIPVLYVLVKPEGVIEKTLVRPSLSYLLRVTAGSLARSAITKDGEKQVLIIGVTILYVTMVYVLSGIVSVVGQSMGTKNGYKNKEPRHSKQQLGPGLPHRMVSTHEALYDIFPAYAVVAAILYATASSAPLGKGVAGISVPSESLSALVLHVFLKLFVYAPAYLADVDVLRSAAHLHAMAALIASLVYLLV
jgi:uncharacterized MAPEG superfamily protein